MYRKSSIQSKIWNLKLETKGAIPMGSFGTAKIPLDSLLQARSDLQLEKML